MYNNSVITLESRQIKKTFYTSFLKFYFILGGGKKLFRMLKKKCEIMSFKESSRISGLSFRSEPLPFDEQSRGS